MFIKLQTWKNGKNQSVYFNKVKIFKWKLYYSYSNSIILPDVSQGWHRLRIMKDNFSTTSELDAAKYSLI
jgi:hypothetical protein